MLPVANSSLSAERERPLQRRAHALDHAQRVRLVGDVLAQHRELVAAEAGDGVARPHGRPQAGGDRPQQRVAGPVAEAVVDHLEAVEVEEQHEDVPVGARRSPSSARASRSRNAPPVGQVGERVVVGLVGEPAVHQHVVDRERTDARRPLGQRGVVGGRLLPVVARGPARRGRRRPGRTAAARCAATRRPAARSAAPAAPGASSSTEHRRRRRAAGCPGGSSASATASPGSRCPRRCDQDVLARRADQHQAPRRALLLDRAREQQQRLGQGVAARHELEHARERPPAHLGGGDRRTLGGQHLRQLVAVQRLRQHAGGRLEHGQLAVLEAVPALAVEGAQDADHLAAVAHRRAQAVAPARPVQPLEPHPLARPAARAAPAGRRAAAPSSSGAGSPAPAVESGGQAHRRAGPVPVRRSSSTPVHSKACRSSSRNTGRATAELVRPGQRPRWPAAARPGGTARPAAAPTGPCRGARRRRTTGTARRVGVPGRPQRGDEQAEHEVARDVGRGAAQQAAPTLRAGGAAGDRAP